MIPSIHVKLLFSQFGNIKTMRLAQCISLFSKKREKFVGEETYLSEVLCFYLNEYPNYRHSVPLENYPRYSYYSGYYKSINAIDVLQSIFCVKNLSLFYLLTIFIDLKSWSVPVKSSSKDVAYDK